MNKPFKFKFIKWDEWGNAWVHCPVCSWTFKLDGVRNHIVGKASKGDKKHKTWLKEHKWDRGTRAPAIHNIRS